MQKELITEARVKAKRVAGLQPSLQEAPDSARGGAACLGPCSEAKAVSWHRGEKRRVFFWLMKRQGPWPWYVKHDPRGRSDWDDPVLGASRSRELKRLVRGDGKVLLFLPRRSWPSESSVKDNDGSWELCAGCSGLCKSTTPSFPRRCSQASRPSLASCYHWSFKGGRGSMGHGSKLCAPVLGPWVSCCVDWAWAQLITGEHGISCSTRFQLCVSTLWTYSVIWILFIHMS